ncbi:MAG: transporter substrate-binding domain-containing protein [Chromatiaceae bacterium]
MSKSARLRYFYLALVLLVVMGGLWFFFTAEEAPKTIRVGWYEHPSLFTQDPITGQPTGYLVAVLEQIASLENLRLEYVQTTRSAILDGLNGGKEFLMAMPITVSEGRKKYADFSWPVSKLTLKIAGRADKVIGDRNLEMEKKTIGSLQGALRLEILQYWYESGLIAGVESFETSDALVDALLTGKVDYIFDETEFIDELMRRYPDSLALLDNPDFVTPAFYKAFPVALENKWLLNKINYGLRQIMNDGTYSGIHQEYHAQTVTPKSPSPPGIETTSPEGHLPILEIDDNYNAKAIMDNYFDMISNESEGVRNQASIEVIDRFVNEGMHEFQDKFQHSTTRLNELLLLIEGQPKYAPYFAAFYYRQVDDLRKSFEGIRANVESYRQKIELENIQMINNLKMIKLLEIPESELLWRKEWIEKNFDSVISSQTRWIRQINDLLSRSDDLQAQLDDIMVKAEGDIFENYKGFYLHRFNFLGNSPGKGGLSFQWHELSRSMNSWIVALPTQLLVVMPNQNWWPSLLRLFLASTLTALIVAFVMARYEWIPVKQYLRPYIILWLGIFFWVGAINLPSTNGNLLYSFATLSLSLAVMDAAWKARGHGQSDTALNPFLFNLISLFLIDLVTDLLAPHRVLLSFLLVLAVVNIAWFAFTARSLRCFRKRDIDSVLIIGSSLWLGAGIAAWLGYLYPAMMIAVFGVLALAVFYAGTVFTHVLLQISNKLSSSRRSLASFISTLVIPFLWLFLSVSAIHWSANIFNANWFFINLYDVDLFPNFPIKISLRTVFLLTLSGLLVKYVLNWLGEILIAISDARQLDLVSLNSTFLVIRYIVWILFAIFVFASLGIDWDNLKWIVGGLSVGFGFALKDILENFFSGIIVLLGKQVRPGDTIEFGSVYGKIEKINIRATFIKTEDNALIAIPNSQIVSKEFRNWTLNGHIRRNQFEVGVAYGSDIPMVIEAMLEVMNSSNIVLKVIPPDVLFVDFASSAILLRARYWVHVDNRTKSASVLRRSMEEVFRTRGIVIAFPQLDVHWDISPSTLPGCT